MILNCDDYFNLNNDQLIDPNAAAALSNLMPSNAAMNSLTEA